MKTIQTKIIIGSIRYRKDRSISFSCETPELTPEEAVEFTKLQNNYIEATLKPTEGQAPEMLAIKSDLTEKKPSTRLRNVLFVWWSQEKPDLDFEEFYLAKMEQIINHIKSKLT